MQKLSLLFLFLIPLTGCSKSSKSTSYLNNIMTHRYDLNIEFSDKKTTPLTNTDFKKFSSLAFFPIDTNYRFKAKFEWNKNPKLIEMPTTTDRLPIYKTYGVATFNFNGEKYQLQVYQDQELILKHEYKDHLFIPFMDKTMETNLMVEADT